MAKGFLAYGQQVGKLVNEKGLAVSRPRLEARPTGCFAAAAPFGVHGPHAALRRCEASA